MIVHGRVRSNVVESGQPRLAQSGMVELWLVIIDNALLCSTMADNVRPWMDTIDHCGIWSVIIGDGRS